MDIRMVQAPEEQNGKLALDILLCKWLSSVICEPELAYRWRRPQRPIIFKLAPNVARTNCGMPESNLDLTYVMRMSSCRELGQVNPAFCDHRPMSARTHTRKESKSNKSWRIQQNKRSW